MSVIINGKPYDIPGVATKSWLDNPKWHLKAGEDRYTRRKPVTAIVLHTTTGSDGQKVKPGFGSYVDPLNTSLGYWNSESKSSGAHMWIGRDGTVWCLADLATEATPHAGNGSVNDRSIGIEIYSSGDANTVYAGQLGVVVKVCDFLTKMFPLIQRQLQWPYLNGRQPVRIGPRGNDKADFYGIFGHREAADNRGRGDPGDAVFQALIAAGYEAFDTDKNTDKTVWAARQKTLGLAADGIPGMATHDALLKSGKPWGKWVSRPDDSALAPGLLIGGLVLAYLAFRA